MDGKRHLNILKYFNMLLKYFNIFTRVKDILEYVITINVI